MNGYLLALKQTQKVLSELLRYADLAPETRDAIAAASRAITQEFQANNRRRMMAESERGVHQP